MAATSDDSQVVVAMFMMTMITAHDGDVACAELCAWPGAGDLDLDLSVPCRARVGGLKGRRLADRVTLKQVASAWRTPFANQATGWRHCWLSRESDH